MIHTIHTLSVWLLVAGFFGAGLFNVVGTRATRAEYVAWGYPEWWHWVTGGLEIVTATFIAIPPLRGAGIVLGTLVILAAVATLLRFRVYRQLPPAVAFLVVIALAVLTF
jgi:hypothetical protein